MVLYDKNGKNIDVYSMEGNAQRLREYKRDILSQTDKNSLFLNYVSNHISLRLDDILSSKFAKVNINELVSYGEILKAIRPGVIGYYNEYYRKGFSKCQYDSEIHDKILKKYIDGKFDKKMPVCVYEEYEVGIRDEIYWLLMVEKPYVDSRSGDDQVYLDNIINLPAELYLLHLLLKGKFSELVEDEIEEQLKLFDINYVQSISIESISSVLSTGLARGNVDKIIENAEIGSRILKQRRL